MGKSHDVLKKKDAEFHVQQKAIIDGTTTNATAWGLDSTEITAERDAISTASGIWGPAFAADVSPSLKNEVTTSAKNLARKNLEALLRPFIQRRIRGNTLMTDTDVISINIKPIDLVRTDADTRDDVPICEAQPGPGNSVHVYFRIESDEEGHESRGLPEGVDRVEFKYIVSNEAPASPSACNETTSSKRNPLKLSFDPSQAGTRVYIFARWINTRNEPSANWSIRISIIIPGS